LILTYWLILFITFIRLKLHDYVGLLIGIQFLQLILNLTFILFSILIFSKQGGPIITQTNLTLLRIFISNISQQSVSAPVHKLLFLGGGNEQVWSERRVFVIEHKYLVMENRRIIKQLIRSNHIASSLRNKS